MSGPATYDTIDMSDDDFKLLLTLCAHDFRHDFMDSSARVHSGYLAGFSGGCGGGYGGGITKPKPKTKHKQHKQHTKPTNYTKLAKQGTKPNLMDSTLLAYYLNDIIFLNNLRENKVKHKTGAQRVESILVAMNTTNYQINNIMKVLRYMNKAPSTRRPTTRGKSTYSNFQSVITSIAPVGAFRKRTTKKPRKSRRSNKTAQKIRPIGTKGKGKTKGKAKTKGGGSSIVVDGTLVQSDDMGPAPPLPSSPPPELPEQLPEEPQLMFDHNWEGLGDALAYSTLPVHFGSVTVDFTDLQGIEDEVDYFVSVSDYFESPEDIIRLEGYINELERGGVAEREYAQELREVIQEILEKRAEVVKNVKQVIETEDAEEGRPVRRSRPPRAASQGAKAYNDNLVSDTKAEAWALRYEIYYEMFPIDTYNATYLKDTNFKILPSYDVSEFTRYYGELCTLTKNRRLTFDSYIQFLNNTVHPDIQLVKIRKLTPVEWNTVKQFGDTITKAWYMFISGESQRAISPPVLAPDEPVGYVKMTSPEQKLYAKMMHSLHACNTTDGTVFSLFKKYFTTTEPYASRLNHVPPAWKGVRPIINNASKLKKYSKVFPKGVNGDCYVPSVVDAMSNCSSLTTGLPGAQDDIFIRVQAPMGYITYEVTDITEAHSTVKFTIACKGQTIEHASRLVYRDKPLSVVNVIQQLVATIQGIVGRLEGGTIEEKITNFGQVVTKLDVQQLVLPIFCSKMFGDVGQELFALAKNYVFTANDRPSSVRYILMKKYKLDEPGGGGYLPDNVKNALYI